MDVTYNLVAKLLHAKTSNVHDEICTLPTHVAQHLQHGHPVQLLAAGLVCLPLACCGHGRNEPRETAPLPS